MRLRSIFPSLWQSETFAALPWDARFMLMGLWSYADDEGRGLDRVALISAALFPFDLERGSVDTFQRVAAAVDELAAAAVDELAAAAVDERPPPASSPDMRSTALDISQFPTGASGRSPSGLPPHIFPAPPAQTPILRRIPLRY